MTDFDFIVVGAGAAGCALAARLAENLPKFTVLLVDAGGHNDDKNQQTFGERHWTLTVPGYNWGYKTTPQQDLNGREVDYSRGKGLGGSTAINFCVYTRGPSADYDHWAELLEDDCWSWKKSSRRFDKVECRHDPAKEIADFADTASNIGTAHGHVDVEVPDTWDPGFGDFMKRSYQYYPKNLNHNSGNPLGISVCQLSARNHQRVTAGGAYLSSKPPNLNIMIEAAVTKVLFDNQRAIGIEANGKHYLAKREIILTAGAIDSPKLLLLSGIGPSKDLQELNIPVIQDLPGVGKNLQDRLFLELVTVQQPESHHRTSYIDSPAALEKAREEWMRDKSGPLSDYYLPQMIAYLKSDKALASQEFQELPKETQEFLQSDTKPLFEIVGQNPSPSVKSPEKYLATAVAFPGNHSTGELKLKSSDPKDPPLINPNFLNHPFDKRLAIESVRETLEFLRSPLMAKDTLRHAAGPEGDTDEAILKYVQETAISMWHACGTVKMGKVGEEGVCVDRDFRVLGIENLRVADMSVAPFLPSAHLQAVAYLIGETAAEKIVAEYS